VREAWTNGFQERWIFPVETLHFPEGLMRIRQSEYLIDTSRREISRQGQPLHVEPQVFDLLVYLIQNDDHVVSKDELFANVWGGRIVSDATLSSRINAARAAIGDSGERQEQIRTLPRRGFRFIGAFSYEDDPAPVAGPAPKIREERRGHRQDITFCCAPDSTRIAYASVGKGPPLVKAANWMNHLQYDWESPFWGHILQRLAEDRTLVRYDARGTGLSDGEVSELSLDAWVSDLETVVAAAGLEHFPLLGISQGCAIAIAYAVRHPERVTHLILFGGFAVGAHRRSAAASEERSALVTLVRTRWGQDNAALRQMFATLFMPSGTKEQHDYFCELQRRTVSPEMGARYLDAVGHFDVTPLLGSVRAPTLVMHIRDDAMQPLEQGRLLAAGIPGARFVVLPGANHLPLEGDPGLERFFTEIATFLDGPSPSVPP
jgi:pimeloyl-ACP methyl ester carboxylesterase/DNA-binding winged helix-turn-helix (wHTH) protein